MTRERSELSNNFRVVMTLTEEAGARNPIGGPGFKYWGHALTLESALQNCTLQMRGMCRASRGMLFATLVDNPPRIPNFGILHESDFVLSPEVFDSYRDCGEEIWIPTDFPEAIEKEKELASAVR